MIPALEAAPTARLEAHFASARGKTQLERCFAGAPLKIAKTFALDEGIGVCVMDCSPGLLAGDCYQFEWHLAENSRVFIATQGFTRVHPSRENPCRIEQKIRLEHGAVLEWFPEPLMMFRDAALRSECDVEMAPCAALLWSEIVCAGRVGRGEAFEFHWLQNRLRVRREGQLIFLSQTATRPARLDPKRVGAWHGFTHQGQFLVFSPHAGDALQNLLRDLLEETGEVWSGVSLLEQGGISVLFLGRRACDLQEITVRLREATGRFLRGFSL